MFDFGPHFAERVAARDLRSRLGDLYRSSQVPETDYAKRKQRKENGGKRKSGDSTGLLNQRGLNGAASVRIALPPPRLVPKKKETSED